MGIGYILNEKSKYLYKATFQQRLPFSHLLPLSVYQQYHYREIKIPSVRFVQEFLSILHSHTNIDEKEFLDLQQFFMSDI